MPRALAPRLPDANAPHRGPVAPRSNVPATLSSFIGRADDVEHLRETILANRLVTVVGPGGVGKTRLAREVAASLAGTEHGRAAYPDGLWWVELAPVHAGSDVAGAVAGVLSVNPTAGRQLVDALSDAVRAQRLLLVLDNCEHLLNETARLVDTLLRAAPEMTVVCTSREALAVDGERTWRMRALRRPSAREHVRAEQAATFEAVQLFVERAHAATPAFALDDANAAAVATICARLDGLPLAIELAAAVVPVLGIDALAERIDDALTLLSRGRRTAVPRHRTLHAVLDWSYTLLGDDERALLRMLSVFHGSFSLDEMEEVCAAAGAAPSLLPALGRLVEHSLLEVLEERGEARYRLLETVRQFGAALLRDTPEEREVRERHARWVAHLASTAEPALFSPARGRTVERLRHSIEEIRAALAWGTGPRGARDVALEIGGALGWFWISGLPWEEARRLVDTILAAADADGIADTERPLAERLAIGRLLYPLKGLAFFAGDTTTMLRTGERERALWASVNAMSGLTEQQRLAADRGLSLALQLDGIARAMRGEVSLALEPMNHSIEVAERSGDPWILAVMMIRRALVHFITGNHGKAAADYDAAIPSLRAQGELWFLSLALEGMSMNTLALGDTSAAARQARESVTVLASEPDPWFISRSLDTLAFVLITQANAAAGARAEELLIAAARLVGAGEALRRRCGAGVIGPDLERNAEMIRSLRARLGGASYEHAHASGAALSLDEVMKFVESAEFVDRSDAGATTVARASSPGAAATRDAHRLDVRVLGQFTVRRDGVGQSGDSLPMGKVRELLLLLLMRERVTKDDGGLALWPDASAAQVRNAFHVTLHHLRRQLGPERWIVFEQSSYRLDRAPAGGTLLVADVDSLLAASTRVRDALRRRERPDAAVLDDALQVFQNSNADLAPGFAGGEWLVAAQDRVRAAWSDGLEALAQLFHAAGRRDDAIVACESLVAREPLREGAHRLLMESLALRGESARAVAHYELLVATLAREVGARPSAETRALAERLHR